jgi:lysophospholipase L1-like esterase
MLAAWVGVILFGAPIDAPAIEDPSGVALDGFLAALERTERGDPGAITRVLHLGDSSIGMDGLPHAMRRRMQERFGDAGVGFVFAGRKSNDYQNRAASLRAHGWTVCYIAFGCDRTGHYGLGGHVFRGDAGARTRISTRTHGRTVSRFELWYAEDPRGGSLAVRIDGGDAENIDTRGRALVDRWHAIDVEPGAHEIELRATGRGTPRVYGVVLENDGPGVVWDTVSMIGAFTTRLLKWQYEHIAGQIAHRAPDLLVLGFGGNDLRRLSDQSAVAVELTDELRTVLRHVRAGRPGLACLVVSVVDHARAGPHRVHAEHVLAMVAAQREAAFAEGCAFFDALAAMGGPGSMRRGRKLEPPLSAPDLQHLSEAGRDRLGGQIFDALMVRYAAYVGD